MTEWRRSGRAAASMLGWAGLVLGVGCTQPTMPPPAPPTPEVSVAPPAEPQETVRRPPRPARKPAPRLASLPPAAGTPLPPEPAEEGDFDRLKGLDALGTVALLGEPRQRAEAPPAVLWRYASRDCELDVYFYLDLQSREMRVLHYEVRDHDDGAERTQPDCYRELVAERRAEQDGSSDRPR